MLNFIKNLFNKKKYRYGHFCAVAKKDKNGQIRYFIYIDGKRCKREVTISGRGKYEM